MKIKTAQTAKRLLIKGMSHGHSLTSYGKQFLPALKVRRLERRVVHLQQIRNSFFILFLGSIFCDDVKHFTTHFYPFHTPWSGSSLQIIVSNLYADGYLSVCFKFAAKH